MTTTGIRELRQRASDLVRRAEAGETITVTVSGREVAQLGPVRRDQWRSWTEISSIFAGPADQEWAADRERVDQTPREPFSSMKSGLDTSVLLGPMPDVIAGELAVSSATEECTE